MQLLMFIAASDRLCIFPMPSNYSKHTKLPVLGSQSVLTPAHQNASHQ